MRATGRRRSRSFGLVLSGKIKSEPQQVLPLAEAAQAHYALESRKTTGTTVLVP